MSSGPKESVVWLAVFAGNNGKIVIKSVHQDSAESAWWLPDSGGAKEKVRISYSDKKLAVRI